MSRIFLIPLLTGGLLLSSISVRADFNDGVAALVSGDYDKALQTFVPLAETSHHAYAQYFLGRMYGDGRGVERNPEEAAKWLRKAAEQGVQEAQFRLAACYEKGDGVPRDLEYAYGWYSVAAHLGNPKAGAARDAAGSQLSGESLKAAAELAADLAAKYGKTPRSTSVSE